MSKQTLDELISQTPTELEPNKDLWPNIERRLDLDPQPTINRSRWTELSVACAIVLLTTIGFFNWPNQPSSDIEDNTLIMLAQLKTQHIAQVEQLQQALSKRVVSLRSAEQHSTTFSVDDPWSSAIDELRQAAALIYQALRNDPHDKQLLQLWLWTQSREIELMQQSVKQTQFNDTRNDNPNNNATSASHI